MDPYERDGMAPLGPGYFALCWLGLIIPGVGVLIAGITERDLSAERHKSRPD